jgi:hypothetical protein
LSPRRKREQAYFQFVRVCAANFKGESGFLSPFAFPNQQAGILCYSKDSISSEYSSAKSAGAILSALMVVPYIHNIPPNN